MSPVRVALISAALASQLVSLPHSVAQPSVHAISTSEIARNAVHHRSTVVNRIRIFYREAGSAAKPRLLLLHGFPSSSHMYRGLLMRLADDFHILAPDYPGFGFSDHPPADRWTPSFDSLETVMSAFVEQVGFTGFTVYMQDFGGPVGFRMATKHPEWIEGIVIQNANAYLDGIAPEQVDAMRAPRREQIERLVSGDFTQFMYRTGSRDGTLLDPAAWHLDGSIQQNAEARRIQTELMMDYPTNLAHYARWQSYLRESCPRTLVIWGKNDPIFLPRGAEAYRRDVPDAELQWLDAGHFALEEDPTTIASAVRRVFGQRTSRPSPCESRAN